MVWICEANQSLGDKNNLYPNRVRFVLYLNFLHMEWQIILYSTEK